MMNIDLLDIQKAPSVTDALFLLRDKLKPHGVRDLVYGYMLRPRSYIQHDLVHLVTFPDKLMHIYNKAGGINSDPVADSIADNPDPYFIDIQALFNGDGPSKFQGHRFVGALLNNGYKIAWIMPVVDVEAQGFGALTAFQIDGKGAPKIDPNRLKIVTNAFHQAIKTRGQLGAYFKLTAKEIDVLQDSASGKSAKWTANKSGISTRAVELRLQSARNKLKAQTTTEAVFKAAAYGILRDR